MNITDKEMKFYLFAFLGLGLALIIAIAYGMWEHGMVRELREMLNKRDTTTTVAVVHDTITDTLPKIVTEKVLGVIRVPVHQQPTGNINDAYIAPAELSQSDSVPEVVLPLTQKEYSDDSTYRAWVSGYEPQLDSIRIFRKTITNTVTVTLPAEKHKRTVWQRFGAGIQGGYGYGIDDHRWHPYVGLGASFNF